MTQPEAFLPGAQRALSSRTAEAIGRNPDRRTGTVLSFTDGELTVQVAGGSIVKAGYLDTYINPAEGDVVALLLQRSTWLALGRISDQNPVPPVQVTNGVHINPGSQFEQNYVFIPIAGSSFLFTKRSATTRLFAQITGSGFADSVTDVLELGVRINGTDSSLALHFFNIANCHFGLSGFDFLSGIPAGTYTVQPIFRINSGPTTVRFDANDRISCAVTEVI
jgi:hypothetical protein